jgi:phenylpropionate dioxygenase-like ring-hydroxylating dioxygenase large terminal subunit
MSAIADPVEALIEDVGSAMEDGLLPAQVFNDPKVHQLELERIFARAWVFVGHESEVPQPGDYCLRYIGEDTFIFVRDEDGQIQVLFDGCRHRGVQVCRAERGNASHFRCSYHGWTYRNNGELIGVPGYRKAYKGLNKSEWGLLKAAKVESFMGIVFATLDEEAPPLDEYLSSAGFYLGSIWGLFKDGYEVICEPHRILMPVNWKTAADNFTGDGYHTMYLHKSQFDIGVFDFPVSVVMAGYQIHHQYGHSTCTAVIGGDDDPPFYYGFGPEYHSLMEGNELSEMQERIARRTALVIGNIFPNLSYGVVMTTPDSKNEPAVPVVALRQWRPRGPAMTEALNFAFAPRGVSAEVKAAMQRSSLVSAGSSGTIEQDDTEPWTSMTKAAGSTFVRKVGMKLNYQMALNGIGTIGEVEFPGPGTAYGPERYAENPQRNLWAQWYEYMSQRTSNGA